MSDPFAAYLAAFAPYRALALRVALVLAGAVVGGVALAALVAPHTNTVPPTPSTEVPAASLPAPPLTTVVPSPTEVPPTPSVITPATALPTDPTSTAPVEVNDPTAITLELTAPGRITKVIRPAARRVSLENGVARIMVAPFHGELQIEVEVADKSVARGTAREGGPMMIRLTPVKSTGGRPQPWKPTRPNELHRNPYE